MQLRASSCQLVMSHGNSRASPLSAKHATRLLVPCVRPVCAQRLHAAKLFWRSQQGRPTNLHCDRAALGRASAAAVGRARRLADGDAQSTPAAARMRRSLRAACAALARRPCVALASIQANARSASHRACAADRWSCGFAGLAMQCPRHSAVALIRTKTAPKPHLALKLTCMEVRHVCMLRTAHHDGRTPVAAALPEPWEPATPLPLAMATLLLCVAALPAPAPDAVAPPARHALLD